MSLPITYYSAYLIHLSYIPATYDSRPNTVLNCLFDELVNAMTLVPVLCEEF